MSFGFEQEDGSLIAPMALAHSFHPIDIRLRNRRRDLWFGWCVSSWWPLFPPRSSVLIFIYLSMRMHSLYEFCYRTFIYIQQECRSVLVKLHPITFYRTVILFYFFLFFFLFFFIFLFYFILFYFFFWGGGGSWVECHFLFSLIYQSCLALWQIV